MKILSAFSRPQGSINKSNYNNHSGFADLIFSNSPGIPTLMPGKTKSKKVGRAIPTFSFSFNNPLTTDHDKDGMPSVWDCNPNDPNRMGGQYDQLTKNVSKLPPGVQQDVYNAIKTGYYGALNTKKGQAEYKKARVYLDQFFNTAEGRRFYGGSIDPATGKTQAPTYTPPTQYSSLFENPGQTNVEKVSTPTKTSSQKTSVGGKTSAQSFIDKYSNQYTNPITQQSVSPSQSTSNFLNKYSNQYTNPILQQSTSFYDQQATQRPPVTSNVVSLPPSEKTYFQESVAREGGYISAIPPYVSSFLQRKYGESETKRRIKNPDYREYQTEATGGLFGTAATVGLYATPYLGEVLFVGEGIESYGTKKGREKLKEEKEKIGSAAYVIPAAEIGLGLFGFKGTRGGQKIIEKVNKPTFETFGISKQVAEGGEQFSVYKTIKRGKFTKPKEFVSTAYSKVGTTGSDTSGLFYARVGGLTKEIKGIKPVGDVETFASRIGGRYLKKEARIITKDIGGVQESVPTTLTEIQSYGKTGIYGRKSLKKPSFQGYQIGDELFTGYGVSNVRKVANINKPDTSAFVRLLKKGKTEEETFKILEKPNVKKTPFSKTFEEKPVDLISPRIRELPKTSPKLETPTRTISKSTKEGLKTQAEIQAVQSGIKSLSAERNVSNLLVGGLIKTAAQSKIKPKSSTDIKTGLKTPIKTDVATKIKTDQPIKIFIQQPTPNIPKQTPRIKPPTFFPGETIPREGTPFRPFRLPDKKPKEKYVKGRGFNVFLKVPKQNGQKERFVKVNEELLTKQTAADILSERLDKTSAVVGKISQGITKLGKRFNGQKPRLIKSAPTGYSQRYAYKFNKPNVSTLVERKRYRRDSVFERRNPIFNNQRKGRFRL